MSLMKPSLQVGTNDVHKAHRLGHTHLRVLLGHSDCHLPAQRTAFHNFNEFISEFISNV